MLTYTCFKRCIDVAISALSLVFLIPIFIPLALALRLTGEGEVFYRQERVGYLGRRFQLLKFATMLKNSPNIGSRTITTKNDPRVLPLGKFLRKTKLNELPQILNVLRGDMSLVGPRPQTQECFEFFPEMDRQKIYWSRPGLTGVGSIIFRNEEEILGASNKDYARCYREDIMPYKQALEIWYHENRCFTLDLKLMLLTVAVVLVPETSLPRKWLKALPKMPPFEEITLSRCQTRSRKHGLSPKAFNS